MCIRSFEVSDDADELLHSPEDSEIEVENMKPGIGEMVPFPSIWGHWAGGPGDSKEDVKWLNGKLREVGLGTPSLEGLHL